MASVAKFKLNEAPRLLTHCSRTQKTPGSHIHQERTCLNFNMAAMRGFLIMNLLKIKYIKMM